MTSFIWESILLLTTDGFSHSIEQRGHCHDDEKMYDIQFLLIGTYIHMIYN